MRLVRVRLRNFRGVTDATVEFSEQVTIVEGPNEVGKSSIAEALRLLRGTKAGSRHRDVVAVQPIGSDVGPEVEVELRSGAYDLVFRKRWLRSPLTELAVRAPRPEQLSGDAAHERFSALLAESVDLDLLDALEVVQGRSLDRPDLATITALHRALDGTAVADDHDDLLERIEEEYARYFTAGGKPTGNYRKVTDEIAGLESELAGYQGRSAELDWFVEDRARQAALREECTVALAEAERELAGLEQQAKALDELRATVASAEGELTTAEAALQQATDAQRSRRQLAEEVADRTRQLAELEGQAEGFAVNHQQLSDDLQAARASAGQAGRHRHEARQVAQTATTAIEHHRLRAEHGEVGERLQRARAAEQQRLAATADLANATVDDATAQQLGDLLTEVRLAERLRESAAAQLRVTPFGQAPVMVNGSPVPVGGEHLVVLETVRVEVAGVVAVEVRPGTPPAKLDRDVTDAREALADALRTAGAGSVEEAREIAARRRAAQSALEKAEAGLTQALAGSSLTALEERLATLIGRLDGLSADLEPAADLTTLEQAVAEARQDVEAAERLATGAHAEVERLRDGVDAANLDLVRTIETANSARQELDRAGQLLASERAQRDDAVLAAAVADATAALGEKRALADACRAELAAADPDTLDLLLTNARKLVESRTADQRRAGDEVVRLDGLIADRLAEGIYDRVSVAEVRLEAARASWQRQDRAAQAVRLLRATMLTHRDEAQRRYVAPFKERIERLGRVIFGPGFTVRISQQLAIESRTLNGRTVPFESLSAGTREQLALLGRLACAQLVDPAEGAPVILDDTLGFADPARLKALGAVLGDVGQTAQVVLLTCQPHRFDSLGGARVVHLTTGHVS